VARHPSIAGVGQKGGESGLEIERNGMTHLGAALTDEGLRRWQKLGSDSRCWVLRLQHLVMKQGTGEEQLRADGLGRRHNGTNAQW
jgi:hypothetical protein